MGKRDAKAFRERFNRWKNGEQVYDKGRPITDNEYIAIMEDVASKNNPKWNEFRKNNGEPELSEDEELRRILNDNTYNYRGYYNKYPNSRANADTHWTDEFKTVYHPTFSVQSKYSGKKSQYNPEGVLGGQWSPNETYVPAWGQRLPSQKLRLPKFQDGKDRDNPPKNIISIPEEEIQVTPEVNQPIVARPIGHYGPTTNVSKDLPIQPTPKMLPQKTSPRYSPVTNKENKNPFSSIDGSYLATQLPTNALHGGFVKAGTFLQEDVAPRKLKYSTKYDKDVVDLNRVNSRPIFVGGGQTRLGVGGLTNRDEKAKIEGYTPVWMNTAFENEYTDVNGNVYHNPEYKNMSSKYARILLHEWAHSEDAEANPEKKYMQWNLDRNELRTLQNAYKPKKSISENQYPDIFEKKATNREIRYKISEDSGNLTGDALTKYINEMDDDTLIQKYWKNSPINGYIQQLETPDAKAFKKALIEVAQNNTLRMPDGYLYARNGKDLGIHIKPSHRGRLTALKKRTGKSEAELYRTGSPATRKMITFARNARKWRKS